MGLEDAVSAQRNTTTSPSAVRALPAQQVQPENELDAWGVMYAQAKTLVNSGFLPKSVNTPEKAIAIMMTGEELGIPKMLALRSIHIINGTPMLSADLMAGLVQREIDRHGDGELRVMPPTADECTVHYRRWGRTQALSYTYTMKDAQRAGLHLRDSWKAHPAAMLKARAVSAVCRMEFPDIISGLYAPEEFVDGVPHFGTPSPGEAKWSTPPHLEDAESAIDDDTGEIETVASVKSDIEALAKQHRIGKTEMKALAVRLELPPWDALTIEDARALRAEIEHELNAARTADERAVRDEDAPDEDVQEAIWEDIPGEAGDDFYTRQ